MKKIIAWIKEQAGLWAFGGLLALAAGGIYAWTESIVDAQIAPVNVRISESVKRLDSADESANEKIRHLVRHIDRRFDELSEGIKRLDEKFDRKFELLLLRLPSAAESGK